VPPTSIAGHPKYPVENDGNSFLPTKKILKPLVLIQSHRPVDLVHVCDRAFDRPVRGATALIISLAGKGRIFKPEDCDGASGRTDGGRGLMERAG
jgi:hypothetical protein